MRRPVAECAYTMIVLTALSRYDLEIVQLIYRGAQIRRLKSHRLRQIVDHMLQRLSPAYHGEIVLFLIHEIFDVGYTLTDAIPTAHSMSFSHNAASFLCDYTYFRCPSLFFSRLMPRSAAYLCSYAAATSPLTCLMVLTANTFPSSVCLTRILPFTYPCSGHMPMQ